VTDLDVAEVERCVIDALERMCFVLAEPSDPPPGARYGAHVVIELRGDEDRTRVLLSATDGFLAELAASMLGGEASQVVIEDDGVEALMEITNVCAGEVIRLLGGEDRPIHCGLPEVVSEPDVRGDLAVVFESLGELLRLRIERAPHARTEER